MFKKNIEKVKNNIIKMLKNHYKDCEIKKEYLSLLNEGKFANATTFRYNDVKKLDLTIKDFSGSPYLIKKTLGKLFISIEGNTIKKLKNNPSVTKGVVFLSSYTLAFNFIKGKSLKKIKAHEIPKEFFLTLEKNIKNMHKKDIVHLDLRNLGNILMNENGYPYIIDFQSCISTKYLPQN